MMKSQYETLKAQCPLHGAIERNSFIGIPIEVFDTEEQMKCREIELFILRKKVVVAK
jgi:hypothetical protein